MSTAALLQDAPAFAHSRARWIEAFRRVRHETERRAAPLSPEDQVIQSMPDASPIKWHRAHTTWFFETFLVQPNIPDYKTFDQRFAFLFNSYYVAAGPRHARPKRGLITRPNAAEVADYRAHVDAAVEKLIAEASAAALPEIQRILEIGLNHEEQHQELMLTDILHAFAQNPTAPAYDANWLAAAQRRRKKASSICPRASTRSAIRPKAIASTMKARRIACWSGRCASRARSSPTANGSNSSRTAATPIRRCGSPTAGPRCRTRAGRRPVTGRTTTANGSSSRSAGCSRSIPPRPSCM